MPRMSAVSGFLLAVVLASCSTSRPASSCRCEGAVPEGGLSTACGTTQCIGGTLYMCDGMNHATLVGTGCVVMVDAGPRLDAAGGCSIPPSQGPTQPCCPGWGPDACGAGFFCAAYDGRTVPSCYANGSRLDGQSCAADTECASTDCNLTTNACRTVGSTCEQAIGCATIAGRRRGCVRSTSGSYSCMNVGTGAPGTVCRDDSDCTGGTCDTTIGRCPPNIGLPCMFDSAFGHAQDAGCAGVGGPAYCLATYIDNTTNVVRGYCVDPCDAGQPCPTGTMCDFVDNYGTSDIMGCVPTCVSAATCPLPENGCYRSECGRCVYDTDCRSGRRCSYDATSEGACL